MRVYRVLWSMVAGVSAVGGLLGLVTIRLADVIILALLAGVLSGGVYATGREQSGEAPERHRRIAVVGLAGAGVVTTGAGLVGLFGGVGFFFLVLLIAGSPPCLRIAIAKAGLNVTSRPWPPAGREHDRLRSTPAAAKTRSGRGRHAEQRPLPQPPVVGPPPDCRTLDMAGLCLAWRRSFIELTDPYRPGQLRTVRARQAYLDELQRRDPTGFARWMNAGARAASDPARYLNTALGTDATVVDDPEPSPHGDEVPGPSSSGPAATDVVNTQPTIQRATIELT